MTIALRAHHLLCTLTYVGKGYNAPFVANYDAIAAALVNGEPVRLVAGPDDICAPLCDRGDRPHCLGWRATRRDTQAARDLVPLIGVALSAGTRFRLDGRRLVRLREAFAAGTIRAACAGCQWHALCSAVARRQYAGTRI